MSKTVHPYAHRLVTLRDWKSHWIASGKKYAEFLRSDILIRRFLEKKLRGYYISLVEIERNRKTVKVIIHTSRPGMIIGRSGEGSIKLKQDLLKLMDKEKLIIPEDFKIDILEVANPFESAAIVAYMVAEGLEKRMPYKKVIKQLIEKVMASRNVKGARIWVTGRLGGAEIARSDQVKKGSVPLQTIRADVDFAREKGHLPYGDIGIKVWIYKVEKLNNN